MVPACRTLDCISVFSLTVDDAMTAAGGDGRARRRRSVFAQPAAGGHDRVSAIDFGLACRATGN